MTLKQVTYVENIVDNLNKLAMREIFLITRHEDFGCLNRLDIKALNTAYIPELRNLLNLIGAMRPLISDEETTRTIW